MNPRIGRKFSVVKKIMCSIMLFVITFSSASNVFYSPVMAQGVSSPTQSNDDPPNTPTLVPLWMRPQAPTGDSPDETGEFQISQTVETGTGDNSFAYNGEPLTYTIVLRNLSNDVTISNTLLYDIFAENSLDNKDLSCNLDTASIKNCTVASESKIAPLPSGNTIVVTRATRLEWRVPLLDPGDVITLAFSGQLVGKDEGDDLPNLISVRYEWRRLSTGEHNEGWEDYNLPAYIIEARVRPQTDGGTSISKAPVWFAEDWAGGTLTQDWADFDYDGDLDLALGSSLGTLIYENDGGNLNPLWKNVPDITSTDTLLSYGLTWAQLDLASESMELVVVGDSLDDLSTSEGKNYIYSYQSSGKFEPTGSFTTSYQLVRVIAGDFDGDGDIDLIGSTNWVNATCPVRLYRNDGSGHYTDTANAMTTHHVECISDQATAALGAADIDNDGDLDLALGAFPSGLRVLTNNHSDVNHPITDASPFENGKIITIESKLQYIPYDLKWGDFNQDGLLDLAAAYPLQQRARIYQAAGAEGNITSFSRLTQTLYTKSFMTPLALDWGDFSGDGKLDLIVADFKPEVYSYDTGTKLFKSIKTFEHSIRGQAWSIRGADISNKHNLDIAITNQSGASYIFTTLEPKLDANLTKIPPHTQSPGRNDVSWGNMDSGQGSDKDMDLVLGSADAIREDFGVIMHLNEAGNFGNIVYAPFNASGFGPHVVAIGDVNNDGLLDIAVGRTHVQLYINRGNASGAWETIGLLTSEKNVYSLAWGDANDDGLLDLLVGYENGVYLYNNSKDGISQQPSYAVTLPGQASSLAWTDFNNDHFMDFAVGIKGGLTRVYANYGDGTFDQVWKSDRSMKTTGVAWADYDADGDLDLAVGNYEGSDYVWETTIADGKFTLNAAPSWTSTTPYSRTTDVAWGDWDSDGYPELAVAKLGQPDIVYANVNYLSGGDALLLQWQSTESYSTTAIAWGDADGDGDLDLAISEETGKNGYYQNTLNGPAHLSKYYDAATPLNDNPTYVYVARPGKVGDAYLFSAAEILATFKNNPPTPQYISITYTLYDPEGADVTNLSFEYSLDGGGTWSAAPMAGGSQILTQTTKEGTTGLYVWNAGYNKAISDNARFRVCYTPRSDIGNSQHAKRCGVSPPFRVRAISCVWPRYKVSVSNPRPGITETVYFTAEWEAGQSTSNRRWNFGDGNLSIEGDHASHVYNKVGVFIATYTAQSDPGCEVARPASNRIILCIGSGCYPNRLYIPIVLRGTTTSLQASVEPEASDPNTPLALTPQSSPPVAPKLLRPQAKTFVRETTKTFATPTGYRTRRITNYALGVNSQPSINYNGSRIAFWSTGRFTGQNTDGNIEIFLADIDEDMIEFTQVTSSTGSILAGFNLAPTINHDGNRITFFSDQDLTGDNPDHNFEIFLAEVDASSVITLVQVTQTPQGANTYPSINANGDLIAFASDAQLTQEIGHDEVSGYAGIFLAHLNKDISGTWVITYSTVVTPGLGVNDQPAISADGKRIAFVSTLDLARFGDKNNSEDGSREIFLAEISGDKVGFVQITDSTHDINESPTIDENGTHIAFVSDVNRQIYLATITHTQQLSAGTPVIAQMLTAATLGSTYDQPHISADGARIAYIEEFHDIRVLKVYDTVEGSVLPLLTSSIDEAYPSVSGDGKDVAYVSNWEIYLTTYPLADMTITKTNNITAIINPGDEMTYTITVSNGGPSSASNVVITDAVPAGLEITLTPENKLDHTDDDNDGGFEEGQVYVNTTGANGTLDLSTSIENPFEITSTWQAPNLLLLLHTDETEETTPFDNAATNGPDYAWCSGNSCPTRASAGKLKYGLFFDGVNDSIQTITDFDLGSNNFTIMLWFNPRSVDASSGLQTLVGKYNNMGQALLLLGIKNGQYYFNLRGSEYNTGTVTTGWQHLAVVGTVSGAQTQVSLYRNGELLGQTFTPLAGDLTEGGTAQPWSMGKPYISNAYFYGAMDEIAILNIRLVAEKIRERYVMQRPNVASYSTVGFFESRVMTEPVGAGWRSIAWETKAPNDKELPDNRNSETDYAFYNAKMSGNVLLMHMNDPQDLMTFRDSSGGENDGDCQIDTCPQFNADGRFNAAQSFNGGQRVRIPSSASLTDLTHATWSMWIRQMSPNSWIELEKGAGFKILIRADTIIAQSASPEGKTQWTTPLPQQVANTWFHIAITRTSTLTDGVAIYVNGTERVISYTSSAPYEKIPFSDAGMPIYIGGHSDTDLDELAIFNYALDSAKLDALYLRGTKQVQFQVRVCPDDNCTNIPFTGPENRSDTYYSELNNVWNPYPAFALDAALPGNQSPTYFQYRAYLGTNILASPKIISVTVAPQVECEYDEDTPNEEITLMTCHVSSQIAPLDIQKDIKVNVPAEATVELVSGIDPNNPEGFEITNTVRVFSQDSDHVLENNKALQHTSVLFIPIKSVNVDCKEPPYRATGEVVNCCAIYYPINASLPVTYDWEVTTPVNMGPVIDGCRNLTWNTEGEKIISATVTNPYASAYDVAYLTIEVPVNDFTLSASNPTEFWDLTYFTNTVNTNATDPAYLWSFGDGVTGTLISTYNTHEYLDPLTYTARLTASNHVSAKTDAVSVTVKVTPVISLTKTVTLDPAELGDTLTYTIRITNECPITLTGVLITDTLSPYVHEPASQTTLIFDIGTLEPVYHLSGNTAIRTFTATVTETAAIENRVTATSDPTTWGEIANASYVMTSTSHLCAVRNERTHTIYNRVHDAVVEASNDDVIQIFGECTDNESHGYPTASKEIVYIGNNTRLTFRGGFNFDFTPNPANYAILDANGQGRAFYITGLNTDITIENIHITGGHVKYGDGGGVYIEDATVTITKSKVTENVVEAHDSNNYAGGGIYMKQGTLNVYNTEIANNTATGTSDHRDHSDGGGIGVDDGDAVTIEGSLIHDNTSDDLGGGIYLINTDNVLISGTYITNNQTDGNSDSGGGVYAEDAAPLDIYNTIFTGNATSHNSSEGGGICIESSGDTTVVNSVFQNNNAGDNGGGIFMRNSTAVISTTRFFDNQAGPSDESNDGGGGITIDQSTATLYNNVLARNHANLQGGAVYIDRSTVTMVNNTIAENSATGSDAAIYINKDQSGADPVVNLYNTIITSQTIGVQETVAANHADISINGILWQNIMTPTQGDDIDTPENAHPGTADFVAPAANDYHIRFTSDAIDQAVLEYPTSADLDNEPRRAGYQDLGADEYAHAFQFTHAAAASGVLPGGPVTYTVVVINTGSQALSNVRLEVHPDGDLVSPFASVTLAPSNPTAVISTTPSMLVSNMTVTYDNNQTINYVANARSPLARNTPLENEAIVNANEASTLSSQNATALIENAPPVANPDEGSIDDEHILEKSFNVVSNDTDSNNDPLTVTGVGNPTPNYGETDFSQPNDVIYRPANRRSNYDVEFNYTVSDGIASDQGTVHIAVTATNDAPTAANYTLNSLAEDIPVDIPIACDQYTDPDEEDTCVTLILAAVPGSLTPPSGTLSLIDHTFHYAPALDFTGTVYFDYTWTDGALPPASDSGRVTLTFINVNDPPVAEDDGGYSTPEDTPYFDIPVRDNDHDPDHPTGSLSIALLAGPEPAGCGSVVKQNASTFRYAPTANFHGEVTFSYVLSDPLALSDTAQVTVTVTSVNDAPVAANDSITVAEGGMTTTLNSGEDSVLDNDIDVDGDVLHVGDPGTRGTTHGTVTINADGTFTYTNNGDEDDHDSFTYQVCDPAPLCAVGTVNIQITPVNDTPEAVNDSITVAEGGMTTILSSGEDSVLDNDIDDDVLHVGDPGTRGTAHGTVSINTDGTFTYTNNGDEDTYDSFTYQACDATLCDEGTVNIQITLVNDAPVAVVDSLGTINENDIPAEPTLFNVRQNDTDDDHPTPALFVSAVSQPVDNTSNPAGITGLHYYTYNVTYAPQNRIDDYTAYFSYTISDPEGATGWVTNTVMVNANDDTPIAGDFSDSTLSGTMVTLHTEPNVNQVDANDDYTLRDVTLNTPAAAGTASSSGKDILFDPKDGFTGVATISYKARDNANHTSSAGTITVTVNAPILGTLNPSAGAPQAADARYLNSPPPQQPPSALQNLSSKARAAWSRLSSTRLHPR